MTRILMALAVAVAVASLGIVIADDKAKPEVKKDEKKPVGALPPNPLDSAFEKATTVKQLDEALLNHPTYQKAVREALKAKKDAEDIAKKNPPIAGPSPAQVARQKFLAILSGATEEVGKP